MRTYKSLATILLTVGSLPASFGFSVSNRIQSQSLKLPTHSFSPNLKTLNARTFSSTRIHQAPLDEDSPLDQDSPLYINTDPVFDGTNTVVLVAGQSLLIGFAVIASKILNVPNFGLGQDFVLDSSSIQSGAMATLPLFALAAILDVVEKYVPALEDVSKATQRSVLGLMGGARQPLIALGVSIALGAAAGLGEEMLFRGVLQSELSDKIGELLALGSSALIFGALHAVTPLYALLAGVASLYFGELYIQYDNLAVPIVCHGLYDVGALMAAHWSVSGMSEDDRIALANWEPPVGNP